MKCNSSFFSCTIYLAFYFAKAYYTIIRELLTGKGFADVCFLQRKKHQDKPAEYTYIIEKVKVDHVENQ